MLKIPRKEALEKLFSKGRIGKLEMKNRAVMSPMATDFANPDGTASERLTRYYEDRAKGCIGLIINEYTGVDDIDNIPALFRSSRDHHMTAPTASSLIFPDMQKCSPFGGHFYLRFISNQPAWWG